MNPSAKPSGVLLLGSGVLGIVWAVTAQGEVLRWDGTTWTVHASQLGALFTIAFATDRGLAPIDALKASVSTVRSHVGETLISFVAQGVLVAVGLFACLVGVLVTGPLALLIQVYTYRRLSGGPVAPPTP